MFIPKRNIHAQTVNTFSEHFCRVNEWKYRTLPLADVEQLTSSGGNISVACFNNVRLQSATLKCKFNFTEQV